MSLSDLPYELLSLIVEDLKPEDLLTLAKVSRRLNLVMIPLYLETYNINFSMHQLDELVFNFSPQVIVGRRVWDCNAVLKALMISVMAPKVSHLSCHVQYSDRFLRLVAPALLTLCKKSPGIDTITVEYSSFHETEEIRRQTNILVAEALEEVATRCNTTRFSFVYGLSTYTDNLPLPALVKASNLTPPMWKRLLPWKRKTRGTAAHAVLRAAIKTLDFRPYHGLTVHSYECAWSSALRQSTVDSHTLRTLSIQGFYSRKAFEDLLDLLIFPNLLNLNLFSIQCEPVKLDSFLARHPTIQYLSHSCRTDDQYRRTLGPKVTLPALHTLCGIPNALYPYLARAAKSGAFPVLDTARIFITTILPMEDDIPQVYAPLKLLSQRKAKPVQNLSLVFLQHHALCQWLEERDQSETVLPFIEKLEIRTETEGLWTFPLDEVTVEHVIEWASAVFPNLQTLSLVYSGRDDVGLPERLSTKAQGLLKHLIEFRVNETLLMLEEVAKLPMLIVPDITDTVNDGKQHCMTTFISVSDGTRLS